MRVRRGLPLDDAILELAQSLNRNWRTTSRITAAFRVIATTTENLGTAKQIEALEKAAGRLAEGALPADVLLRSSEVIHVL